MTLLRILASILALLAAELPCSAASKTSVRLLLAAESAKPGDEVIAAVELRMAPGWHTYWKNGGDSGAPTEISWQLPAGISAGSIQWPTPQKLDQEGIVTYAFDGTVLLRVPLRIESNAPPGIVRLKANVAWVECHQDCLPGSADVEASLRIGLESKPSADAPTIEEAKKRLPLEGTGLRAAARWLGPTAGADRALAIEWDAPMQPVLADFYPERGEDFQISGTTKLLEAGAGRIAVQKSVHADKPGEWPRTIQGLILIQASATVPVQAYTVVLPLANAAVPAAQSQPAGNASLLAMLGLAFLGGLILNIMPCVLPVIALKILGFVNQSREHPGQALRHGLIYTLGVLVSFIVLASAVIGVQQAGKAANWGMQFQNPQFLVAMTVLVTLVALNLFGVFEVTLGGGAMNAAGTAASQEGTAGAFLNGVLATVLATPCTAPFLSLALGFAFAQPPGIIVLMFSTIGLGLASPYLLLSWRPDWLRFLPKPGLWMQRFKVAMGFPMLATAFWLFSLTLLHFETGATFTLGLFLALLAMAAWIWGEFSQRSSRHPALAKGVALGLLVAAYFWLLEGDLSWRHPVPPSGQSSMIHNRPDGIQWKPWSAAAVEEARAAGHPVLVDFTAYWCPNCLLNKKTSLEIDRVRNKLREIDAVALLADYSKRDPVITAELQRHGRAAVPLVLVFPADRTQPPIQLPELLTPGKVLDALDRAAAKPGGPKQ